MPIIRNNYTRFGRSVHLHNDAIVITNGFHTAFVSFAIVIISNIYIRVRVRRIIIKFRNIYWYHHQSAKEVTRCLGTWYDLIWL